MKSVFVLLVLIFTSQLSASCWTDVVPGQYSKILDCSYHDWQNKQSESTLQPFLQNLFYLYFTDGTNKSMRQFFDQMRNNDSRLSSVLEFKERLIHDYEQFASPDTDAADLPMVPQKAAALLFVLSQTDPESLPPALTHSIYLTVYNQIDTLFVLNLALSRQFGVLPASEYLRMLEIVKRMSWVPDPYMKATNHYFQGILLMHLHDATNGMLMVKTARVEFSRCLETAQSQVARKRILFRIADTNLVEGHSEEAIVSYITILKADPQDWDALMALSKILYNTGQCADPGVWVEASITSKQQQFQLTIHCGNKLLPEEQFEDSIPSVALMREQVGLRPALSYLH